jgi:choline-sulfatase
MIRRGDWKLIYYHGQEPQLFNLATDPHELEDRAQDAVCQDIRQELIGRALDGWDVEAIIDKMAAKKKQDEILRAWARNTAPAEQFRWVLRPEMNYLDE